MEFEWANGHHHVAGDGASGRNQDQIAGRFRRNATRKTEIADGGTLF